MINLTKNATALLVLVLAVGCQSETLDDNDTDLMRMPVVCPDSPVRLKPNGSVDLHLLDEIVTHIDGRVTLGVDIEDLENAPCLEEVQER